MTDRSRSPPRTRGTEDASFVGSTQTPAIADVAAAHALRKEYQAPAQSKFRVAAVLRFRRADGSEGTIQAVNAEPHDGNIRGAICAERAALCRFQLEEGATARILRVVCVTDAPQTIYPGPLCREFLTSACGPDTEIVASGSQDTTAFVAVPLRDLLPCPSVFRRLDQPTIKALGSSLAGKVRPPLDTSLVAAYTAARDRAAKQVKQFSVFPVAFAAAARFEDGRVHCVHELKGIEYGCTVDAVSLLIPELVRAREEGAPGAVDIFQVDNHGIAHAPFASARSLLVEHGFGSVQLHAHSDNGEWATPMTAKESLPHADFEMF